MHNILNLMVLLIGMEVKIRVAHLYFISPNIQWRNDNIEKIMQNYHLWTGQAIRYDQHWCNIFQYAIQVTLEKWISLTVMGLLATWFGYGKEYLLFLLIFIPLRSFGGGLHMKTYIGCLVCSCLMVGGVLISSGIVAENMNIWLVGISGILACIPVNIMAPVLHINRPMKKREIIICKRKVKMFTVILAVVQLFLSGCNRRNLVALISETIWLVLIFMVLGNIEYEKENHKVA